MNSPLFFLGAALLFSSSPLSAETIFSQDFESVPTGPITTQEGWSIPANYGKETDFVVQKHIAHTGTQSLQVLNTLESGSGGHMRLRYTLAIPGYGAITPSYLASKETNNFWIDSYFFPPNKEDNATGLFGLQLNMGTGTVTFAFTTDATINHGAGAKYKNGEWNRLTIHVFVVPTNGLYDLTAQVYLNGTALTFPTGTVKDDPTRIVLVASGTPLTGVKPALAQVRQIGIGYKAAANTGDGGYWDDLRVTLDNPLDAAPAK